MQVDIIGRGVEVDDAVTQRVARRLGFALGRFGERVGRVTVHLTDTNGPRGGVDKRCRVLVDLTRIGPVVVEDEDSELGVLIDRTADRTGQIVRRRLDRARLYAGAVVPRNVAAN
ncbi:MAG: HPF/RaiA family ribosome-associated protein [Fimbriiglobus sp.]